MASIKRPTCAISGVGTVKAVEAMSGLAQLAELLVDGLPTAPVGLVGGRSAAGSVTPGAVRQAPARLRAISQADRAL